MKGRHHFEGALRRLFHDHPASVGETYWQHFAKACGFGLRLVAAGVACLLHAIVPGIFQRSASSTVARVDAEMRRRVFAIERRGATPAMDASRVSEPSDDRPRLHAAD